MKKINILLAVFIAIAVFINFYKQSYVPGCINADEAAFGYNAFSILKTFRDEHGALLPLRLLSFNDMKLPLYSYLSIPFIAAFGLNSFSTRLVSNIVGILLIPLIYYLTLEAFRNKKVAYLAAFLASVSPWIYIISRHAHETGLSALFIGISIWMLMRYTRTKKYIDMGFSLSSIFLATFSYHTARIFLLYVVGACAYLLIKDYSESKKLHASKLLSVVFLIFVLVTPFLVDMQYGTNRVNTLFFTHNAGFQQKLDEYLREDPVRSFHNKGTQFIKEATLRYFQQISPEFFVINGDANPRFGMEWLGLITPVEFVLLFIGLYYLFKNKQKNRYFIASFLLLSPISNSLTWNVYSLTRTYPMIIPILITVSYGFFQLYDSMSHVSPHLKKSIYGLVIMSFIFFNLNNHDLYFNHYFNRPFITRSWQCGYKDLSDYVKEKYDTTDNFYITRKYGQPYIFLLYYLQYDPFRFHHAARLSKPDEYGFTQVESFDKFSFELPSGSSFPGKSIIVGFPDDFKDRTYDASRIKKITYGREEIFWIYKTD